MKSKIKCFPPLRMYWFEDRDIETVGYHVTPYVNEILEDGYIYSSGASDKSTLGSPIRYTISFASNLDDAKALAQSLAIYALLSKGLMSYNEFKLWVKDNFDVRFKLDFDIPQIEAKVEWIQENYGDLSMEALEDGSWVDIVFWRYGEDRQETINALFETLHTLINFVDPKIYSDAWIHDLPNDKDGLLSSIGIFECKLTSKTLVDPSLGRICYGGLYSTENAKGAEILGLDWEILWGGAYTTSESIEDINNEFRNIEGYIADLWVNYEEHTSSINAETINETAIKKWSFDLPYHDPYVEVDIVDEIPISYCRNTILYLCYESEFTIFSEGVPVSEQDVICLQDIWNVTLPYTALAVRSNPYSQTDDEGYLINPTSKNTMWWHWSDSKIDEFIYRPERPYTFIASTRQIVHYMADGVEHGYLYRVRVEPKKGVYVLERDDVFEELSLPLERQLESMLRKYGLITYSFEDGLRYMTGYFAEMAESDYPALFRHFSRFSCMREPFRSVLEKQNPYPTTVDTFKFNISAYLEGFEAVQAFFFRDLRDDDVSSLDTRIPHLLESMGFHGWFEREIFGADINIGIDLRDYDVTIMSEEEIDAAWGVEDIRSNPYNRTDAEGYLINPNDGSNLWYHFDTSKKGVPPDFEFQMQGFTDSKGYNETYFAGHPLSYEDDLDYGEVFTVKIRIGRDCTLFDARDLFRKVPDWVIADITRAFNEVEDVYEPNDILFLGDDNAVSQRTLDYLNSGDLGETLNLWRKNEVYLAFRHKNNQQETWTEWLLWLWMLQFNYVYRVLSEPETFPILDSDLTRNIVGWLEREKCDSLSPEWNAISAAIAHNDSYGGVGYMYLPCLDETKIEIVKRDRRYK